MKVIFHFVSKKDSHQFNESHIPLCFQEGFTSIQWKSYSTLFPRRIHINSMKVIFHFVSKKDSHQFSESHIPLIHISSKKVIFHFVSKNSYQFNERHIPWNFFYCLHQKGNPERTQLTIKFIRFTIWKFNSTYVKFFGVQLLREQRRKKLQRAVKKLGFCLLTVVITHNEHDSHLCKK